MYSKFTYKDAMNMHRLHIEGVSVNNVGIEFECCGTTVRDQFIKYGLEYASVNSSDPEWYGKNKKYIWPNAPETEQERLNFIKKGVVSICRASVEVV